MIVRTIIARFEARFPRAAALVQPHFDMLRKAVSFGLIGFVNVGVDASVFFLAWSRLTSSAGALRWFDALSQMLSPWFAWADGGMLMLSAANIMSWSVAVSGSYLMNTFITFAAESGRRVRWRDYGSFVASGLLGLIAATTALVIASRVMPVPAAKGCSILAAFAVNFFMSHFVVFRARRAAPASAPEMIAGE
jgi:putative flippase GtrA